MGLLWAGVAGAEPSLKASEVFTFYDVGWKTEIGHRFRYLINMNWVQQYRTPQDEYLMPEHTLTTDILAVLHFQVTEIDEKEGLIAMKVTFEKLEGVRNGTALSLEAVDRMTDLETVMGLVFNKVGLIVPGEPAEIGSTWERTVPMMDPLGESIGKDDRHHAGSTMEFVISRKGYVVKDQPAAKPADGAPPKAPEGSRKFDVTWKGNETWKGIPVAVFRSESETAPTEIERNGTVMTLSGTGDSEVKFAWPQGQPVSAAYQEHFTLRMPGAVSDMLGVITVELDGLPHALKGSQPVFPQESLYPIEPFRLKRLRQELNEARTEKELTQALLQLEMWRALPRTVPVGISLASSVVGDHVWRRMMESRLPFQDLALATEREREWAGSLLREAGLTQDIHEVKATLQEFPFGGERDAGHRMVALAEMDEGRFQGVKWYLMPEQAPDAQLLKWVETGNTEGNQLKLLWRVEWPFPVNPVKDRLEVAGTRYGLACVWGEEIALVDVSKRLITFRGRLSAPPTAQGASAIRVDEEGRVWVFERTPKGWQAAEWRPSAPSRVWDMPKSLFPNEDQKNPLHALEGFLRDGGVYVLGAYAGAARQLMWSAWDVNRRRSRFEGRSLWGVKLMDDVVWQSLGVSAVLEDPWMAGVGTDGTVFLAHALTGKFQWLRKLKVSQVALHPQAVVGASPEEGIIHGLDLMTGETKWMARFESGARVAGTTGEAVIAVSEKSAAAFQVKNGKRMWSYDFAKPFKGIAAVFGNKIAVPEEDGVVLLDGLSGLVLSKFPHETSGPARVIKEGDRLYLMTSKHFTAFELTP